MAGQNNNSIIIKKASGEMEAYNTLKLKASLKKAGAEEEIIDDIADEINEWIYNGITTEKIYAHAYKLFRQKSGIGAIRYNLKKALFELGPTGFPFEQFIGELYSKQGYKTEVGIIAKGCCITHEMDVIATKDNKQFLMECKYSHDQGNQINIQVPLYVRSRVEDIVNLREQQPEYKELLFTAWVVTNARFSADSIKYSKCVGLNLLGWDYPKNNGLKNIIERVKVFPVTILKQLSSKEKQILIEQGIVTCPQLLSNLLLLERLGLSKRKQQNLIKELNVVSENIKS